jgi:hypothetical protein
MRKTNNFVELFFHMSIIGIKELDLPWFYGLYRGKITKKLKPWEDVTESSEET